MSKIQIGYKKSTNHKLCMKCPHDVCFDYILTLFILYKLLIFLSCKNIFVSLQKDFFLYTVSRKHFGTALFWTSKNNICICCEDKNRYPLSIHDMNLSISIKSIQIQVMHKHIFLVLSTQTYGMLDRKKQ